MARISVRVVGTFKVKGPFEEAEIEIIRVDDTTIAIVDEDKIRSEIRKAIKVAKEKGAKCLFVYSLDDDEVYFPKVIDLENKKYLSVKCCRGVEANTDEPIECLKYMPVVLAHIFT